MKSISSFLAACLLAGLASCSSRVPDPEVADGGNPEELRISVAPEADDDEKFGYTEINFVEFTFAMNYNLLNDSDETFNRIMKDTVVIHFDLGQHLEGRQILVSSDQLRDITLHQRYETSITVMNEGPHCDLSDWHTFLSEWVEIPAFASGAFMGLVYSDTERTTFINISMKDVREKVDEKCGSSWFDLIKNTKSVNEYPCGVGISRYYLQISGFRIDDNEPVQKILVFEVPMGC